MGLPIFVFVVSLALLGVHGHPTTQSESKFPQFGRSMRSEFLFDPEFIPLNHGSDGTYPKHVQKSLQAFQARSEANPDLWSRRDVQKELNKVRKLLADFINADSEDVVIIPNATSGMNAIFRSFLFNAGDRILHFSTIYQPIFTIIRYISDLSKGTVTSLQFNVTYPISNDQLLANLETFLEQNHSKEKPIRLALVDHISSAPSVVNPIDKIIPMLKRRNITVLIDGAQAIGQVPINIRALAPDFYITDLHKWLLTPRGCGLMYVDKKMQGMIHPAHISTNYAVPARFQDEFFWTGSIDYTPYMAVTAALEFRQMVGGEEFIRNYTHKLALEGGKYLAQRFNTSVLQEEEQIGNMVDVQLPVLPIENRNSSILTSDFWIDTLLDNYNVFAVPLFHGGNIYARFSAQIYNDMEDFRVAADTFLDLCEQVNANANVNWNPNSNSRVIVNRLLKNK